MTGPSAVFFCLGCLGLLIGILSIVTPEEHRRAKRFFINVGLGLALVGFLMLGRLS